MNLPRLPLYLGALALAACSSSSSTPPGDTPDGSVGDHDGGHTNDGAVPLGDGGPGSPDGTTPGDDGSVPPTGDGGLPLAKARKLGTIATSFDPAFVSLLPFPGNDTALVISTFSASPFGGTKGVSYVPSIAGALSNLAAAKDTALVSSGITWPNEVSSAPSSVFGGPGLVVAGGFLVPGNTTGALTFIDPQGTATKITADKTDWFYHRVVWQDMNGDGRPDALAARATKPFSGSASGELLWFEAPASNPLGGPWQEHSLVSGASAPDVFIRVADLDHDGSPEIIAPQFFSQKLVVYWMESGALKSAVIDDQIGSAFDVQVVDLNGDGKLDLLATNSMTDASKGAVFAYEIPTSFKTDPWPKHVLTTGFTVPSNPLTMPSAPGAAVAVQPKVGGTGKPVVIVASDDAGSAVLLTPSSASTSDWTYARADLDDIGGTCGVIATGDVNGDGWVEMFIPGYGKKAVDVFTFAP